MEVSKGNKIKYDLDGRWRCFCRYFWGDEEEGEEEEQEGGGGSVLHSSGAAGPVAVVEVEAFALEDECAHAVLRVKGSADVLHGNAG